MMICDIIRLSEQTIIRISSGQVFNGAWKQPCIDRRRSHTVNKCQKADVGLDSKHLQIIVYIGHVGSMLQSLFVRVLRFQRASVSVQHIRQVAPTCTRHMRTIEITCMLSMSIVLNCSVVHANATQMSYHHADRP